jgi:hypothetical protein
VPLRGRLLAQDLGSLHRLVGHRQPDRRLHRRLDRLGHRSPSIPSAVVHSLMIEKPVGLEPAAQDLRLIQTGL